MERISRVQQHIVASAGAAGADLPPGGAWGQRCTLPLAPLAAPPLPPQLTRSVARCAWGPAHRTSFCYADDFYKPDPSTPLYNTVKQKLLDGEKVYSISIEKRDVDLYLELRKHYDFVWFEMQHSTLTYADVEAMIKAGSMTGEPGAIPCIRMHSPATEHVFQQCGDIGALIFVVPTVDTVEQAQEAAKWARFPPVARRSTGGGQHARVWNKASDGTYMDTYNDNCLLVVMVETAVGCANAYDIARVPGVDVVITGNYDLQRFTGMQAGDPLYDKMLNDVCKDVKRAGKIFGTTMPQQAEGLPFSDDAQFFYTGPSHDGWQPSDYVSPYADAKKKD